MIQGVPIIDFHAHFPAKGEWFPGYNLPSGKAAGRPGTALQQEIWRKAWNFPSGEESFATDEQAAERWHREAQEKGVERIVFVSGGGNEHLSGLLAPYPDRFIGFAHHHPFAPGAAAALEEAVTRLGLKGYKLLAPAIDRPLGDRSLYDLWEVCRRYRLPVLIHFGILGGAGGVADAPNINPLALHQVAKDFPDVSFVLPHFGAGYPTELLHLCWACPNVYVDSSGSNQWVRWMAGDLTLEGLFRKFFETIGSERLVFATDSSGFPRGFSHRYLEEQNRIVRFLRFKDGDIENFFYKNAARLLDISLP
jgi:hypothetical protein